MTTVLDSFRELFAILTHYLQRPIVVTQMVAFMIAVAIALFLAGYIWQLVGVPFERWVQRKNKGHLWQSLLNFFKRILFPLFGLLSLYIANQTFGIMSNSSSLLHLCINYFWIFAAYRLVIALLYTFVNEDIVRHFHRPIIAPLVITWIAINFMSFIVNLEALGQSQVVNLLGQSLNAATLATTIAQIYLWIMLTTALRESIIIYVKNNTSYESSLVEAWLSILSYISYLVAFIVFLNKLGINENTIAFITGGLSVGIGFGLRSIIANFFSGIILLFERSMRPGDILEVDGVPVTVNQLNIRTTRVETYDGEEVIIPNETMFTTNLHTFTGSTRRVRCNIDIGIHYRHDPKVVCDLLVDLAKKNLDVLSIPEPICFVVAFADSSINLSLRVWVASYSLKSKVPSDLMKTIWEEFKAQGIEMPFPQTDVHIQP